MILEDHPIKAFDKNGVFVGYAKEPDEMPIPSHEEVKETMQAAMAVLPEAVDKQIHEAYDEAGKHIGY